MVVVHRTSSISMVIVDRPTWTIRLGEGKKHALESYIRFIDFSARGPACEQCRRVLGSQGSPSPIYLLLALLYKRERREIG